MNRILPRVLKELKDVDASAIVIGFLKSITLPKDPKSLSIFTKRETLGLVQSCIHLILTFSESGPTIKRSFGTQGVFEILIDVIGNDLYSTDAWVLSLMTIGSLCQGCKLNKSIFGESNWTSKILNLLKLIFYF